MPFFGYVASSSTGPIATLHKSDVRVFSQSVSSVAGPSMNLYWNYIQNIVS